VLLVFAGIDLFLQKREYGKQVRVTKQEAKQEAKEQEGDPLIKARIRSVQRDMARKRMMQAVKKADVIITNPTHIAIALQYDKDKMVAPKVVAKGADFMAERIKQIGRENGVVLVENVPLARAMFKAVKVGQVIPRNLFQAVAEVLAYVYKLKNAKF
jgi:flagellar biosynthetic protein FlhB